MRMFVHYHNVISSHHSYVYELQLCDIWSKKTPMCTPPVRALLYQLYQWIHCMTTSMRRWVYRGMSQHRHVANDQHKHCWHVPFGQQGSYHCPSAVPPPSPPSRLHVVCYGPSRLMTTRNVSVFHRNLSSPSAIYRRFKLYCIIIDEQSCLLSPHLALPCIDRVALGQLLQLWYIYVHKIYTKHKFIPIKLQNIIGVYHFNWQHTPSYIHNQTLVDVNYSIEYIDK